MELYIWPRKPPNPCTFMSWNFLMLHLCQYISQSKPRLKRLCIDTLPLIWDLYPCHVATVAITSWKKQCYATWCSFRCLSVICRTKQGKNYPMFIQIYAISIWRILPSLCKTSSRIHRPKERILFYRKRYTRLIPTLTESKSLCTNV